MGASLVVHAAAPDTTILSDSWDRQAPHSATARKAEAAWPCGAVALADFASLYGCSIADRAVEQVVAAQGRRPMSFVQIRDELRKLGIQTKGFSATFEDLIALDRPVIAQVIVEDKPHLLVLETVREDWVRVMEEGRLFLRPINEICESFSGYILAAWFPGESLESPQHPLLSARPEVIELTGQDGDQVTAKFSVNNVGTSPSVINDISGPEGWTLANEETPFALGPGKEALVRLTTRLRPSERHRLSAEPEAHTYAQVRVRSNDPVRPQLYVTVDVMRGPQLTVSVEAIDFGEGPREEVVERKRTFWACCRSDLGEPYVEPSEPWLVAALTDRIVNHPEPWRREWICAEIQLSLDQNAPRQSGVTNAEVLVTGTQVSNTTAERAVVLPVRVAIWPDVRPHPPELFFGTTQPGPSIERCIEIRSGGCEVPALVLAPKSPVPPGLRIAIHQPSSEEPPRVCVVADTHCFPIGVSQGRLVFVSADATDSNMRVVVPYYLYVQEHDRPPGSEPGG